MTLEADVAGRTPPLGCPYRSFNDWSRGTVRAVVQDASRHRTEGTISVRRSITVIRKVEATLLSLVLCAGVVLLVQSTASAGTKSSIEQIQAELEGAIRLTSLPKNVTPPSSQWSNLWKNDFGAVATGGGDSTCWTQDENASALATCTFGDHSASKTLVLTGDSQAWQWEPSFDVWGRSHGWRVIVLAKGSCQPWPDPQEEYWNRSSFPACRAFQAKVVKYINSSRPRIVVAAGLVPVIPKISITRVKSDVTSFVNSVEPSGAKVLIASPTPALVNYDYATHSSLSAPTCLMIHSQNIGVCNGITESNLIDYWMNEAINVGPLPRGSHLLDLSQLLCNVRCPMMASNILIYIDNEHVSYGWAVHVAPALGELLAPYLS